MLVAGAVDEAVAASRSGGLEVSGSGVAWISKKVAVEDRCASSSKLVSSDSTR